MINCTMEGLIKSLKDDLGDLKKETKGVKNNMEEINSLNEVNGKIEKNLNAVQ